MGFTRDGCAASPRLRATEDSGTISLLNGQGVLQPQRPVVPQHLCPLGKRPVLV